MDNLDLEELMHLAIHASSNGRNDDAINYLKKAQEIDTENAHIAFLLAAEYAQIKMYDRALTLFEKTTQLAPELSVARLQWGLLLIMLEQSDNAKATLEPLTDLEEESPYKMFSKGLLALLEEQMDEAKALFAKGIESNHENEPLNNDFRRIINNIDGKLENSESTEDTKENANEFLLSTYNN
ncbi:M48 family metallopeptidase [Pleionea sp. CnH1-48]|uniref:tetratricopeptide repeat protein n=1 Tax=Pleionea sp. CnH1-48 TaxID=2954494 RepID=UPI00209842D8|nr:tetratricopeptide repeat protein [Pleionea sp. CnH1-48]MCO7223699.1 hypothetical protein [Pleionea sp. CnH1-48]